MKSIFTILFFCFLFGLNSFSQSKYEIPQIIKNENGFQLLRNGSPYYVKGAGGIKHLKELSNVGGNSIRTWGVENGQAVLDSAHKHGLTVCMGLWVNHERHGFDYNDEYSVKAQLKGFEDAILKYKNHPALLMWAVGNEVDLFYSNFRVWNAVEEIAALIKQLDPNHPTMTVTAGIDMAEVSMIKRFCPSIDILGINTYGGIGPLADQIRKYGWEKPYMVTEWGPYGHWESPTTSWGVSIESNSSQKAQMRLKGYKHIEKDKEMCIGSYAFLWGHKQEQTPTWYGIFTEDGKSTESVDVLNSYWAKNKSKNKAPILNSFLLNNKNNKENIKVKKRKECLFLIDAIDFEKDSLTYTYELLAESTDKKAGGDFEVKLDGLEYKILNQKKGLISIKAPGRSGPYRFYVYVSDNYNNVATANIPFYVK
jgi:hypothetical protein